LLEQLEGGPVRSTVLKCRAEERGFSTATFDRARNSTAFEAFKDGSGPWFIRIRDDGDGGDAEKDESAA
jgi:hypothetical protein